MKNKEVKEKLNKAFSKIEVNPDFDDMMSRRNFAKEKAIPKQKNKLSYGKLIPAFSTLVLLLVLIFKVMIVNPLPSDYLSLDINPSFEFIFNDGTFEINAVNDDAKELLTNIDIENKDLSEVIGLITLEAYKEGYLTEANKEEILITSSENNSYLDIAKTAVLDTITQNDITATINTTDVVVTNDSLTEAKNLAISLGRYEVIKEVAQSTGLSIENLLQENVTTILKSNSMDDLEEVTFYSSKTKALLNQYKKMLIDKNTLVDEIDSLALAYELDEVTSLDYENDFQLLNTSLASKKADIVNEKDLLISSNLNSKDLLESLTTSQDELLTLLNKEIELEIAYEEKELSQSEYKEQISYLKQEQKLVKLKVQLTNDYQDITEEEISEIIDYQRALNVLKDEYKAGNISKEEYKSNKTSTNKKIDEVINTLKKHSYNNKSDVEDQKNDVKENTNSNQSKENQATDNSSKDKTNNSSDNRKK